PLAKMDLIAVPDFAFGAMENWGAITFRENLLLRVPGVTSRLGEERICEVIAHEVAHQWFGNLVTPEDWQYLWLNESFATYFAYKVLDEHRPEWQVWQPFLLGQTEVALERDELLCTFAIEMPGDTDRQVAITESTAPIIYSKGGSILRQVEGFIGAEGFRDGLHRYLQRHAYASAASHHLWDALGEAADKPVSAMMRGWVEQPGHPVVEVTRRGHRLHLRQRRFTLLPCDDGAVWRVPIRVAAFLPGGGVEHRDCLLETEQAELELPPGTEAYKVNADQTGFYRVHYLDPADHAALGPRVRTGELAPPDRWGLHSDLYALVLGGRATLEEYLTFLSWFDGEEQLLPLASIARALRHLHRVLPADRAGQVAEVGARLLQRSLDRIGYLPRDGEVHATSVLRDQILWDASVFGAPRPLEAGAQTFERLRHGGPVAADVVKSALQIGVWTTTDPNPCLGWLQGRFHTAETEHERINLLTALGSWRRPETLAASLRFTLDQVPDRIRFVPLVAAAANPVAGPALWEWFEEHIGELEGFHPMLFERVLAAIVPVAGLADPRHARTFLEAYAARRPQVGEVAALALEKLEVNVRLRQA
ncbi:MAG TPA: M1 family aminopeptidase, partial [Deferrisomatales bacterium]|nr:M1 family aminopeptidase [Deferrisomatales bacterium]